MPDELRVDASVSIPEDELRWRLPRDPAVGRADPGLGGFTTELRLDTTGCAGLDPARRQRVRERVAAFRRTGDVVLRNEDGVITVLVDWVIEPPRSLAVAREHLAEALREALAGS
ncbi:hypothetical protein E0L36_18885 [Streptomyces sp. AJS327]|uniref:hypothetical protein n=1 Tax=Streptomyces sp. AJS327 TaxID=2545265 RepID=UPI0015DFF5AB|nr:hypothetical protein [Streptomyces sp. AJS327]MBA0052863.1 hypothetical protein [Streptomyces sp. AJS327]